MAISNSNNVLTTYGSIQASDLGTIADHFRQWFSVSFNTPNTGSKITAADFNNLRQAIINGAGSAYSISQLPGTVSTGQKITQTSWGYATANFSSETITYTGNGSFTVPAGCTSFTVNQLVSGGGGGGWAVATGSGGNGADSSASAGGGGSGGISSNVTFSVSTGDIVSIDIGGGGTGGVNNTNTTTEMTGGGSSFIQINGNTVLNVTGGSAGNSARSTTAGGIVNSSGGAGGSPNGNSGGTSGGGSSPYGGYGSGGNGGSATSSWMDIGTTGRWPVVYSSGGGGSGGYASITYNP